MQIKCQRFLTGTYGFSRIFLEMKIALQKNHRKIYTCIQAPDRSSKIKQEETIPKKKATGVNDPSSFRGTFKSRRIRREISPRDLFFAIGYRSKREETEEKKNEKRLRHDETATRIEPLQCVREPTVWPEVGLHCSPQADAHLRVPLCSSCYVQLRPRATARRSASTLSTWRVISTLGEESTVWTAVHRAVIAREIRVGQGFCSKIIEPSFCKKRRNLSNCSVASRSILGKMDGRRNECRRTLRNIVTDRRLSNLFRASSRKKDALISYKD